MAAFSAIKPAIRATYRRISIFGHNKSSNSASSSAAQSVPMASTPPTTQADPIPQEPIAPIPLEYLTFSVECFTTFLLSADNSPFTDHHGKIYQDMNLPISDYYISSSHNTYLVGHQLVGVSTIEGYIRALLQSCRSVESECYSPIMEKAGSRESSLVDIYDGDEEPVITHGKTLTSKVPLRHICEAIDKYAFVTSPYPIIISAEVHCGLEGQDMIAEIMKSTFGKKLVDTHIQGHDLGGEDAVLPSPEQLKKRILLKVIHPALQPDRRVLNIADRQKISIYPKARTRVQRLTLNLPLSRQVTTTQTRRSRPLDRKAFSTVSGEEQARPPVPSMPLLRKPQTRLPPLPTLPCQRILALWSTTAIPWQPNSPKFECRRHLLAYWSTQSASSAVGSTRRSDMRLSTCSPSPRTPRINTSNDTRAQ